MSVPHGVANSNTTRASSLVAVSAISLAAVCGIGIAAFAGIPSASDTVAIAVTTTPLIDIQVKIDAARKSIVQQENHTTLKSLTWRICRNVCYQVNASSKCLADMAR